MKLLHVVASMDPQTGGVCQAVRTMITGLATTCIMSEVVSLDRADANFLANDSFPVHALGPSRGPWAYSSKLAQWLLINLSRFDRVILHGLWLYPNYAVHSALKKLTTKSSSLPLYFVMPHGMLDPYFQQASGRKLKAWRNRVYWKLFERSVVNEAAGLLFTCETERLLAYKPFSSYLPQQERVVGLGVEEPPGYSSTMREAFLTKCPELSNRPYLLFLSRIHEKKGVELLIEAYTRITQTGLSGFNEETPELQLPALVIAGPGLETTYGQYIHQLVAKMPGPTTVFFPGMLTGDIKWGCFYGCEAFILPSHQENFGIAVVEALACSKPVLISNQVNIWLEIETTGSGIVADDTLQGTLYLLENWFGLTKKERIDMAAQARLSYCHNFAIKPASEKLLLALEHAI